MPKRLRAPTAAEILRLINALPAVERVRLFAVLEPAEGTDPEYRPAEVYTWGDIAVVPAPETAKDVRALLDLLPDPERERFQEMFFDEQVPIFIRFLEEWAEQNGISPAQIAELKAKLAGRPPVNGDHLARMKELRGRGLSSGQIAKQLDAEGLLNANGERYTPGAVRNRLNRSAPRT